LRKAEGGGGSE
jgi:hypothetical protein